jgi:hypothetical protein
VVYASSSSALATGSALVFNGTNLGVGTATPQNYSSSANNIVVAGTGQRGITIASTDSNQSNLFFADADSGTGEYAGYLAYIHSSDSLAFAANATEQMRLTSTGLGIGTSSPAQSLHVKTSTSATPITLGVLSNATGLPALSFNGSYASTTMAGIYGNGATASSLYYEVPSGQSHFFGIADSTKLTLDSSGNLGLGVTPSAWGGGFIGFQIKNSMSLWSGTGSAAYYSNNVYYDGTSRKYVSSATAAEYEQGGGIHSWKTAASGTAGDAISFTQAMTLDASGRFMIGTTTPLDIATVVMSGSTNGNGLTVRAANSSGAGSQPGIVFASSAGAIAGQVFADVGGSSLYLNNGSGGATVFLNNSSEKARIDSSGNLLVGTTTSGVAGCILTSIGRVEGTVSSVSTSCLQAWNQATSGDNKFVEFYTEGGGGTLRGSITYNRAGGLTAYNVTSDYRAKDITGPVTNSGALIDSVPVYMGKMKDATQERPMFIAHEVPSYAHTGEKDAVDADGNPVYQQMDASALIPVMWAEIQSLRQRLSAANL